MSSARLIDSYTSRGLVVTSTLTLLNHETILYALMSIVWIWLHYPSGELVYNHPPAPPPSVIPAIIRSSKVCLFSFSLLIMHMAVATNT